MIMRLVRDDLDEEMVGQAHPTAMNEQNQELSAETEGRGSAEEPEAQGSEPLDGPVQDAPEEGGEPAAEGEVDLGVLESLLFSTHHPLTAGRLAELLELDSTKALRKAIKALNGQYEGSGRSFRVEQVAGGYQLLTLPEYGEYLKKLHQRDVDTKLTKAALETLAIIAYKQPILRADIEAIRGVACGETIRSLMEKHLVKIAGRAEVPGRPILYGTTKRFLELFGLNSLKDLPQGEELGKPQA
jgi:segregation and condensation protein B